MGTGGIHDMGTGIYVTSPAILASPDQGRGPPLCPDTTPPVWWLQHSHHILGETNNLPPWRKKTVVLIRQWQV